MPEIILPEFGAHLSKRCRPYKFNELLSAPFPPAQTTEEILRIAALVEAKGYLVVVRTQRPVRLRAPRPGENGVVIAETTDDPVDVKRTTYVIMHPNVATGQINSKLWFCRQDYPFFGSYEALQAAWRERQAELKINELIRSGLTSLSE